MALFRVTVKATTNINTVKLEKGMSVEVQSPHNPFSSVEGRKQVGEAFIRNYGKDITRAIGQGSGLFEVQQLK